MDRIKWIDYKNKKILYADFTNADTNTILEIFKALENEEIDYAIGNDEPLLLLYDTAGVAVSEETKYEYFKVRKLTKTIKKYTAIINGDNLVKVAASMLSVFNKDIYFGKSLIDAENWLVSK